MKLEKKEMQLSLEAKAKKVQEYELQIQETKYKSNHMVLQ